MPPLPDIHMLCVDERCGAALAAVRARLALPPAVRVETRACALDEVPTTVRLDLVVSPANSYGRLDGAFDDAISRALAPRDDYAALTRAAQARLYDVYRGFAPPGSCTLVPVPDAFAARSRNGWGVRYVALCPTMRTPADVSWDREVVYECVWSLLCAVDAHNRSAAPHDRIQSMLMTPLATGVGRVSPDRWAHQFVLALRHYADAVANPAKWSGLSWDEIHEHADELAPTWAMS